MRLQWKLDKNIIEMHFDHFFFESPIMIRVMAFIMNLNDWNGQDIYGVEVYQLKELKPSDMNCFTF